MKKWICIIAIGVVAAASFYFLSSRDTVLVSDDQAIELIWDDVHEVDIALVAIPDDHPVFSSHIYKIESEDPLPVADEIMPRDNLYLYNDEMDAWQDADSFFNEETSAYAIGEPVNVQAPHFENLRQELLDHAPDWTIGYRLYQAIHFEGFAGDFLIGDIEYGGCDGEFILGNDQKKAVLTQTVQIPVNDIMTQVEYRYGALWEIADSFHDCVLTSQGDSGL